MHSLQEIKARISTIKKIRKITKAMQLVATAKLIKSKRNLSYANSYMQKVVNVFSILFDHALNLDKLVVNANANHDLYILITSDLGLCGSYNSNVIKLARAHLQKADEVIIIGGKGNIVFRKRTTKIATFDHIGDHPDYTIAADITKLVVAKFLSGEIRALKIIHTEYINSITYNAIISTVLPLATKHNKMTTHTYELEPSPLVIIRNALHLYVAAIIYKIMIESKLAEMTSRRTAMENATDNADDLIAHLDLDYNRARQSKITQEISEIVVGSERES